MELNDVTFRLYRKDQVAFVRDVLGINLRKYQIEFMANLDEHGLHKWCRQSGKNMAIYTASIWKAVFYPNTRIVIGTRPGSVGFTIRELEILAERAASRIKSVTGVSLKHNPRNLEFSNGSKILLSHNMFREEADYLIGNYDVYLPPEIEKEHRIQGSTRLHIFDADHLDIAVRNTSGVSGVGIQIVTWREVYDNDVKWARDMLNCIGEKAFRLQFLATDQDIIELSK